MGIGSGNVTYWKFIAMDYLVVNAEKKKMGDSEWNISKEIMLMRI